MKFLSIAIVLLFSACNSDNVQKEKDAEVNTDSILKNDKPNNSQNNEDKIYSNQRFRNVTIKKIDENGFEIKGQAQVFEATFSWVVEDGHEELKKGFETTTAGAPEWGDFIFTIEAEKKRPNSTLHLIIFESSAKDGSRQFELPILLY